MKVSEFSDSVREKIVLRNALEFQILKGFEVLLDCKGLEPEIRAFLRKWHEDEINCLKAFLAEHEKMKNKNFENEKFN